MEKNEISREAFKHNFLKQIIVRLDFQGVLQAEMEKILLQVKPYLKEKRFNRYEQNVNNEIDINFNNGIFHADNPIKEVRNIIIHSFINEDCGYTIDLSTNYICLKVNAVKYVSFDEYASIFTDIAKIYKSKIDFFTVKRFGLRKINFCFLTNTKCINRYFEKKYFDCYDLFEEAEIFASEKKVNFKLDECKMNLLCYMEQGQLGGTVVYKVTLDSDIYIDDTINIEKSIFENKNMAKLNERLFSIYKDSLTEEFISMLSTETTTWSDEIIGVERNE